LALTRVADRGRIGQRLSQERGRLRPLESGAAATAGAGVGGTALAERIIAEELNPARWQEADLKSRPKGDSVKVAFAARWRAETTMTVGGIAERLAMGPRGYLNLLLSRRRKRGGE
jgi:hypothetical protein